MNWRDDPIENDEEGRPMFKGSLSLTNDKGERLAGVLWFYDVGPFYAHAMDPTDTTLIRRIGPVTTLEGAKSACIQAIEGRVTDLSQRAGYPR
jgi:hypothetical protein